MSLAKVYNEIKDCVWSWVESVASCVGATEAARLFQLARLFSSSDQELQQSAQLKWIPGRLQEWLLKKAIQVFGERTWKYQDSLPPLPVPPLKSSLEKYLESVKPFVTAEEYKETEAVVRQFEVGIGQSLHQQLLERAKVNRNWLEDWWLDVVYLRSRLPLPLNSNISGSIPTFDHIWPPQDGTLMDRVPLHLWYGLQMWKLLRKEQIPVDKAVRTGQPFCMDQFRKMVSTHRIPGVTMDRIVSHFRTEAEGTAPTHITLLCKGRVFKLEVIDPEGEPLTPPELKRQLDSVRQQCENAPEGPHISTLTAENRTKWAMIREKLMTMDTVNAENLSVIEQSIIVLAFDDAFPKNHEENFYETLAGNAQNRWFDHINTIVAYRSGLLCANYEHSPADAMVHVYSGYFINSQLQRNGPHWKGSVPDRVIPQPEELVFTIDDEIREAVVQAEKTFLKQASDFEVICPSFTDYGKKFIRSFKLHPDSYMQTALQLAYFRLHGKPAPTYETATLRQYYHGRTETVRSCTMEVVSWCQAMLDNTVPAEERKELMMAAFKKHIQLMEEAKNMLGFDRHLFGLQVLAMGAGIPLPAIFSDPAYSKSGGGGNFVLSTSLGGYTPCPGAAAPMVHHGHGIFYNIQPDRITYSVSAWKSCVETSAEEMSGSIQHSLRDMRQLLMSS
ncbi:PREDICTED: peroxisomal carnitine O-octanoyltransferase-like isoform X1 [Branchiostoma belcheri]|uniref:Peroxisomal carnitine O-octanoyltransferase n=1 Tax=Branchiostoma belcheri TaxID=7741 RepID=A0A6P4ZZ06_BRABE|nr:PREDICTED: peroxisomal carnitine O-octanoyltransferase-like isoform X1 [Branchiostoma belcheri]